MSYMGVSADVVQVELVGQEWWSNALPILAILISLTSLGITLWLKFRDDARLRLTASPGYVLGFAQDGALLLHLEATNVGRTGTTVVRSIGLRLSDGRGISSVKPTQMDSVYPKLLGPGETAHVYFELKEVAGMIRSMEGSSPLYIEADTGHGKVREKVGKAALKFLSGEESNVVRP
jgi:hypothetical protein